MRHRAATGPEGLAECHHDDSHDEQVGVSLLLGGSGQEHRDHPRDDEAEPGATDPDHGYPPDGSQVRHAEVIGHQGQHLRVP